MAKVSKIAATHSSKLAKKGSDQEYTCHYWHRTRASRSMKNNSTRKNQNRSELSLSIILSSVQAAYSGESFIGYQNQIKLQINFELDFKIDLILAGFLKSI
jgi:hypothetical protein